MATLVVRLSGKEQLTETVTGIEINGFFVHHPIFPRTKYHGSMWTVSDCQSGMNLGATFEKQSDAAKFAQAVADNYDGHCDAKTLIQQSIERGDKPSIAALAEKFGMVM